MQETIAAGIELLVSSGHTYQQIWQYQFRQFIAYVKLVRARKTQEIALLAIATRMSYHGEPDAFSKFVDSLED